MVNGTTYRIYQKHISNKDIFYRNVKTANYCTYSLFSKTSPSRKLREGDAFISAKAYLYPS